MKTTAWNKETIQTLFEKPFFELIHQAYLCHQAHFDPQEIEFCTLSSIKTGACPENCAYCPQSGHYKTGIKKESLLSTEQVLSQAKTAKANGAKRFCMGAAWRSPPEKDFEKVCQIITSIKALGLETCATIGNLNAEQAYKLKEAGLDYYNHNIDTSEKFYTTIIQTHTYQDRLDTIQHVIDAKLNVCCGGIIGMGESREDRIDFLLTLYQLPSPPQSIPINQLIPIPGTPLENAQPIDKFEFIRTIAITRLMFPLSMVRLSAGRTDMSEEMQAFCFMAGANSIFIGDKLLTAKNPEQNHDLSLLNKLNIRLPA